MVLDFLGSPPAGCEQRWHALASYGELWTWLGSADLCRAVAAGATLWPEPWLWACGPGRMWLVSLEPVPYKSISELYFPPEQTSSFVTKREHV